MVADHNILIGIFSAALETSVIKYFNIRLLDEILQYIQINTSGTVHSMTIARNTVEN
jgi:hypothetical protein